jgi:hypothetical protein
VAGASFRCKSDQCLRWSRTVGPLPRAGALGAGDDVRWSRVLDDDAGGE